MSDRLRELEQLVTLLRGPAGCPWDREQELSDLRAYLLEEAHEVATAIDNDLPQEIAGELGDLLFQIVFAATLGQEAGSFSMSDVIAGIREKMIFRHPHVFGEDRLEDSDAVRGAWEKRKLADGGTSVLEGVPPSLPTLLAAYRMTQKAAAVGFDWPDIDSIIAKVEEELAEVHEELTANRESSSREALREEIGDLIFTVANLARRLEIDPEAALALANRKFKRRFQEVETRLAARGGSLANSSLAELDDLWSEVKRSERQTGDLPATDQS